VIGQTNKKIRSGKLQRTLRNNLSDADRLCGIFCVSSNLWLKFRRQHPFGDYILDFVCLENKLVIEVDGANMDSRQSMTKIAHKNCRQLVFVFSGSGTMRFLTKRNR